MAENTKNIAKSSVWSSDFLQFYESIKNCNYVSDINVLYESNEMTSISLNIKVNLPLRRSKMRVDIREVEPILLLCSCKEIKYKAPIVLSNRVDFPVEKLPHTAVFKGIAWICLHRGNITDWYIEHSVQDFINRIRSWFSDAASGRLIKNGDEFEPMLIDEETADIIYSYDNIINWIENYWNTHNKKSGYAFITYSVGNENLNIMQNDYSIKVTGIYEKNKLREIIKNKGLNVEIKRDNRESEYIGILTWSSKDFIYDEYFKISYGKLEELTSLNEELKNNFRHALGAIKNSSINREYSLVITAVNRPTKLIGYNTNIELLNFIFETKKVRIGRAENYDLNGFIMALKQLEIFNSNIALKMSGNSYIDTNKKILFVGVGALGSKIIFHLARNGFKNITVIDNDTLYPHNLARHSLYAESVGEKKAKEIVTKLEAMYSDDKTSSFNYSQESFISYAEAHDLTSFNVIFDFTTSKSVLSYLTDTKLELPNIIVRGELGDGGKLGILMIEGKDRKPRIDELQMLLFKNAFTTDELSEWLRNYKYLREETGEAQFEDIVIGMGCNTHTMRLSDDVISNHASIFANYIKQLICGKVNNLGTISINYFNENNYIQNYFNTISAGEFIYSKCNDTEWVVKLYIETWSKIKSLLTKNINVEVGGILLGRMDLNKKIIYVIDIFVPQDNKGSSSIFIKGSEGVLKYLEKVSYKTGDMIKYVGDWHTHPNFSTNMSITDEIALKELKENMKGTQYPAHIMIFNNDSFSSYIL